MGSTVTSRLRDLHESESVIVLSDQPRLWVNETRMTDLTMSYEHHIDPTPTGCRLTERAVISGPLAEQVAPQFDTQLRQLFNETTALVARRAESLAALDSSRHGSSST